MRLTAAVQARRLEASRRLVVQCPLKTSFAEALPDPRHRRPPDLQHGRQRLVLKTLAVLIGFEQNPGVRQRPCGRSPNPQEPAQFLSLFLVEIDTIFHLYSLTEMLRPLLTIY